MENDVEYIKRAIDLSRKAVYPYGAVIVKDGKIIGEACSGDGEKNDPTNHAETLAVRRACKNINSSDLSGATIYSSCEPCFMCFGTIWWANISKIIYGVDIYDSNCILDTDINITIEELNRKTGNKIKITGGILKEEAKVVMKEWQNKIFIK
jgi:tRNA(Arg) A34 adenosine deaminase TadA